MNNRYPWITILLCVAGVAFNAATLAETAAEPGQAPAKNSVLASNYSPEGADTCIKCHDEDDEYPVFDIFKTKHGQGGDKRSPFASLQCEACHGPGAAVVQPTEEGAEAGAHIDKVRPGQKRPPILNFEGESDEAIARENGMCLNCHEDDNHIGWAGSVHELGNASCVNCHTVHAAQDPVLERPTQPEVCYQCHQKQRAEFLRSSHHPVRSGQMTCTDCHKPHEPLTERLLMKPTLNQTCYTCHAEKRGPFLWEHAPVAEDCTLCHTPHGSIQPALVSKRPPLLCQQCHSQAGHPSVPRTATSLPGASPSGLLLTGACLNCHTQVHGSNHPSGVKLMR